MHLARQTVHTHNGVTVPPIPYMRTGGMRITIIPAGEPMICHDMGAETAVALRNELDKLEN